MNDSTGEHIVLAECVECVRAWEVQQRYGETGYQGALRVLDALQNGYTPIPASDEYDIEYTTDNTVHILYKLQGFITDSDTLPASGADDVLQRLQTLINHKGNIMFVTNPALLPTDRIEFEVAAPSEGYESTSNELLVRFSGPTGSTYRIAVYSDAQLATIVVGSDGVTMEASVVNENKGHDVLFDNDPMDGSARWLVIDRWPNSKHMIFERERTVIQYTAYLLELATRIVENTNITDSVVDGFRVNITFDAPCKLRVYADTFTPPTSERGFEDSFLYAAHRARLSDLEPDTLYYAQPVAEFQDGSTEPGAIVSQRTEEASSNKVDMGGMQPVVFGDEKAIGLVTATNLDAYMAAFTPHYSLTGGAGVGIATVDGKLAMQCRLTPTSDPARPTNRMDAGYALVPERTYRISQYVYIPSDFDGGGQKNGNPFGVTQLFFGLYGGKDVAIGVIDPGGFAIQFVVDVEANDDLTLALCDYSADRVNPAGDRIDFPAKLIRGAWNYMAMEVTVNSAASVADGVIRGWQGVNTAPALNVAGKTMMSSGTPQVDKCRIKVHMGGQGLAEYAPATPQILSVADVRIGPDVFG